MASPGKRSIYQEKKRQEQKEKKHSSKEKIKRKKRRLKSWVFLLLTAFFLTILCFSGYQLFKWHQDNQKIKHLNEDIQEEVVTKTINEQGELINPPQEEEESDYWYYVGLPFYEVDFSTLMQKNSDTIAFIHMKNTNINYPVVQTSDNDYYLHHAFDGSYNSAGWVFMDYRNDINNLSDNTVIYGHGRLDKTVFGSLRNTLTSSWQSDRDNYTIWLSTPNENMLYQIFSIYKIPSESYYIKTTFSSSDSKQEWLNTMKGRNVAPIDTSVTTDDKILTLSTCSTTEGERIVLHAKLIKRQTR